MAIQNTMAKRTPAEEARSLILRFKTYEAAKRVAMDRLPTSRRGQETKYLQSVLAELKKLKSTSPRESKSNNKIRGWSA